MATVNLGSIKFKWKGTYAGGTAYTIDDVVSYNGSSYICIQASTGNLPTDTAYFEQMSAKGTDGTNGTDGTDLTTTLTTQGDIVYRDSSGLARLGAGTSGQALITNGAGANPSWGTISSGTYSVHAFDEYYYHTQINITSASQYHDIAGGNAVSFQPTSTNDIIFFTYFNSTRQQFDSTGFSTYLVMKENSASMGSGDTRLDFSGTHVYYSSNATSWYQDIHKSFILPCTGLNTSSTYYVEQAAATDNANGVDFNRPDNGATPQGNYRGHYVQLIHYKRN